MEQSATAGDAASDESVYVDARARIELVLEDSLFLIVFHPIIELGSRRVVGYEALTRFASEPVRPPDQWFHEAAAVGLGIELELAAVRAALRELPDLPEATFMAVNVSPETALSEGLADALTGVALEHLVLELIESSPIDSYDAIDAALADFRRRGLKVAVDDLGSGFARLRHLFRLKPDVIKLDMALVTGVQHQPIRQALISSMADYADRTGSIVVAEGIEEEEELLALELLGVQAGQGWYFAKPGPLPLLASS